MGACVASLLHAYAHNTRCVMPTSSAETCFVSSAPALSMQADSKQAEKKKARKVYAASRHKGSLRLERQRRIEMGAQVAELCALHA